jgi:hypothetical protein
MGVKSTLLVIHWQQFERNLTFFLIRKFLSLRQVIGVDEYQSHALLTVLILINSIVMKLLLREYNFVKTPH